MMKRRQFLTTSALGAFVSAGTGAPSMAFAAGVSETGELYHQPATDVPVAEKTDVVVCGGGPAGIAAAILAITEDTKKVAEEYSGRVYPQFALLAQFQGDAHNRRIALYDCVITARPEIASKTGKTKTPDTTKVKFAARPRASDNLVQRYTKSDTDATVYANWFTAVQEPVAGV